MGERSGPDHDDRREPGGPRAGVRIDEDFVRRGAAGMTPGHLAELCSRRAELRARFDKPGPFGRLHSDVLLLFALLDEYWDGTYREVPWWVLAAVAFSLLYLLSPADLLPDPIPVIGQIDDVAVLTVCLVLIEQELQAYKRWKLDQPVR
jgi:uncharacterized membrane protein YkvA (DUF1232 family)